MVDLGGCHDINDQPGLCLLLIYYIYVMLYYIYVIILVLISTHPISWGAFLHVCLPVCPVASSVSMSQLCL